MVAQLAGAAISRIRASVLLPAVRMARSGPLRLALRSGAFLVLSAGLAPVAPILLMVRMGASPAAAEAGSRLRESHAAEHGDGERTGHHHE